ncbi:MAG: hypothetical protein HAW59_04150 [Betaproteobacteria bacterium]|nr:hypothetical protein [Betaproteobacteria bacterium]
MKLICVVFVSVALLAASGCAPTIPPDALQLKKESLALKQLQTRRFDGIAEKELLVACAGVSQDLGFTLEESETDLGVLVGAKDRTAVQAGEVALVLMVALLGGGAQPFDEKQKIRLSIVSRPVGESSINNHYVRVTFQRIVWRSDGTVSKQESLEDPDIYQEFFAQLSKSVFLEAHKI